MKPTTLLLATALTSCTTPISIPNFQLAEVATYDCDDIDCVFIRDKGIISILDGNNRINIENCSDCKAEHRGDAIWVAWENNNPSLRDSDSGLVFTREL